MKLTFGHTMRACYLASVTQAIAINLPPLLFIIFQNEFGLSFEQVGRLILINFGTQIISDIVATRYVDRMGYRPATILALSFCTAGFLLMSLLPTVMQNGYVGLMLSVVVFAWGSGFIEVITSPIVESLPSEAKASTMSLLHSFYCWGQMAVVIFTTLFIYLFGAHMWRLLPLIWALVPIVTLGLFTRVPFMPMLPPEHKTPIKTLFTSRTFILSIILMICAGSAENTMSQWSSLFAERGLGVSKVVGDFLGMCLFALFMGIGRALYGLYGQKMNLAKVMTLCAAGCVACYAVTVFVLNPFVALAGCALCGLSVSLMWPGTLSLSAARFPMGGMTLFGVLAICGDVGCSVGPWMAGVVSDAAQGSVRLVSFAHSLGLGPDQLGLKLGLLTGMIFPITMLITLLTHYKKRRA